MKTIPKKIINSILNFRIGTIQKAIEKFQSNKELFLPDSQTKIEEIIQRDLSDKELLFEILNHDYIRPAFVVQDHDFKVPDDHPWAPLLSMYQDNIKRALGSVGVFEIVRGEKKYPSGTGWLLTEDLVVTNQHVAEVFLQKSKR